MASSRGDGGSPCKVHNCDGQHFWHSTMPGCEAVCKSLRAEQGSSNEEAAGVAAAQRHDGIRPGGTDFTQDLLSHSPRVVVVMLVQ